MIAPARIPTDPTLPRPSWSSPVELRRVIVTPDNIKRTLPAGQYATVAEAQAAAGSVVWTSAGNGTWRSAEYLIAPLSPPGEDE